MGGLLTRILMGPPEGRSHFQNLGAFEEWMDHYIDHGAESATGIRISPQIALTASAVMACVKVLAETIASLPLTIIEDENGSKRPAPDHPLHPILHDKPNSYQTSFEWRAFLSRLLYFC